MLLLLDTANLDAIRELFDLFPLDGVTTNPTILKHEKNNPMEQLKKVRDVLPEGCQLHVQVVSQDAEKIVREAQHIVHSLERKNIYIKIKVPVSAQGVKAISALSAQRIPVTATAVYSSLQAFVAAKAGASYVAPYVNRLDNMGSDGVKVAQEIQDLFRSQGLRCGVLAASFRNARQIASLCAGGIDAVTASPEVMENLIRHPATDRAIEDFNRDFYEITAPGKTLLDF